MTLKFYCFWLIWYLCQCDIYVIMNCHVIVIVQWCLASLLSVDRPPGHRFDNRNFISCTFIHVSPWYLYFWKFWNLVMSLHNHALSVICHCHCSWHVHCHLCTSVPVTALIIETSYLVNICTYATVGSILKIMNFILFFSYFALFGSFWHTCQRYKFYIWHTTQTHTGTKIQIHADA